MKFQHTSVLLKESIDGLNIHPNGIYVDATLGGGGHAYEILRRLDSGLLIGIDQDEEALEAAGNRLASFGERFQAVHTNFESLADVLADRGIDCVNGILADLGVSSYQLDNAERGFSYMRDAPLDMRMDRSSDYTAYHLVNEMSRSSLARIIREYGEERFANNVAKHIDQARTIKPIETTGELVALIEAAIPKKFRMGRSHSAKRTFQAIRIALNRELDVLDSALTTMVDALCPGGRLCIISFHSLEDRIVKRKMRQLEQPCICPPDSILCVCGRKSKGRLVTRKPILPTTVEMARNPRAKSAKLRIFERGTEDAQSNSL